MLPKQRERHMVMIPESLVHSGYDGELFGIRQSDTGIFNVFSPEMIANHSGTVEKLGYIYTSIESGIAERFTPEYNGELVGKRLGPELVEFTVNGKPLTVRKYSLVQNIFSRNTGILESKMMLDSVAVILGCGSVGSLVAFELAKSGVGNFVLVDTDILEYHNLCRHQCSIEDVGNYKVNAVKRLIHGINPTATVTTHVKRVEELPKEAFDNALTNRNAIIIGTADDRSADAYSNRIAILYKVPFVSIGFWTRAFAGEVFYHIPGTGNPCYECALMHGDFSEYTQSTNRHIYVNEEELAQVNFEPGISIDITFVTSVGIKIVLDLLNASDTSFTPRLVGHLKPFTLVCNTNNPKIGGDMAEIFSYPLQVTTSFEVQFQPPCERCKYEQ